MTLGEFCRAEVLRCVVARSRIGHFCLYIDNQMTNPQTGTNLLAWNSTEGYKNVGPDPGGGGRTSREGHGRSRRLGTDRGRLVYFLRKPGLFFHRRRIFATGAENFLPETCRDAPRVGRVALEPPKLPPRRS